MQPEPSARNAPRIERVPAGIAGEAFAAGPYRWLPAALLPGCRPSYRAWRDALLTAAVSWVPLALLAAAQGHALSDRPGESFLLDFAAYGRYLIAAPLFVFAGSVYLPQLAAVVRHLVEAGIIAKDDLRDYEALVVSTRRLVASRWVDVALLCVAYAATLRLSPIWHPVNVSTWIAPASTGPEHLTLAGWWRTLVSHPLFLALSLTWFWRMLLWTRFLWRVGRMDLRLIAGHPDLLGGLRFVLMPLRGFLILSFAIGVVASSSIANGIVFDRRPFADFTLGLVAHVAIVVLIFAGPPLMLVGSLFRLQARGMFTYGRLASQLGREFEEKWISGGRPVRNDALAMPDFSATIDLFSVVANVRSINLFMLDPRLVIALVVTTLLPYVPLVLGVVPFSEVVNLAIKAIV